MVKALSKTSGKHLLASLTSSARSWPADKVERWSTAKLIPNAHNARLHTDADIDAIAKSMRRWGITNPPLIDEDGILIVGHSVLRSRCSRGYGGLGKSCWQQLQRLAETLRDKGSIPGYPSQTFKPGTKLIRECKGRVHEVVIAGDHYTWAGEHYRSLSQIARSITGTRWSGPRFFGLKPKKRLAKKPRSAAPRSESVADG